MKVNKRLVRSGAKVVPQRTEEQDTKVAVPYLTTDQLSVRQMLATFDRYKQELIDLYDAYHDKWQGVETLVYFTDVTLAIREDQKFPMLKKLERELISGKESDDDVDFLTHVLVWEWGLRVWMNLHHYDDRNEALERIKLQEKANPEQNQTRV